MENIKITGFQFRWSGTAFIIVHMMISKDAAAHVTVFLHEPFASRVISHSDLKNMGVTSCILVSVHTVLQPTKGAAVICGYQKKVLVTSCFLLLFTLLCDIFQHV